MISHNVLSGNKTTSTASVQLRYGTKELEEASCGDGPVDAVFKAIKKAVNIGDINLKDYQLKAITSGHDALGEATVWIEKDGKIYSGRGLSTDVIEASVRAYIIAINKIVAAKDIKERKFQGGI